MVKLQQVQVVTRGLHAPVQLGDGQFLHRIAGQVDLADRHHHASGVGSVLQREAIPFADRHDKVPILHELGPLNHGAHIVRRELVRPDRPPRQIGHRDSQKGKRHKGQLLHAGLRCHAGCRAGGNLGHVHRCARRKCVIRIHHG